MIPIPIAGVKQGMPHLRSPAISSVSLVRQDLTTGAVISTSLPIPPLYPATGIAVENGQIWLSSTGDYLRLDIRIGRVDAATGQILEEHRNPLVGTSKLASDGEYSWVFCTKQYGFCRAAVEGM